MTAEQVCPDSPKRHPQGDLPSRLLGTYPQRQEGLFMQRIPVFGGRIEPHSLRAIALAAIEYADSTALHLTTRQDIELHNIPAANVSAVLSALAQNGICTFGAGGDSVRNITLCPGCDFNSEGYDVWPAAWLIKDFISASPLMLQMPRKFKVSFSGCQKRCAKPYINDLGFIAKTSRTFTVIGAGSLGPRPGLGIVLYENLPADDVLPLFVAALEMFVELGQRQNRSSARLRHVREKLGDDEFRLQLDKRLAEKKSGRTWQQITLSKGKNIPRAATVQLPLGDIAPETALLLAESARTADAVLRINLEHGLEVFSPKQFNIPDEIKPFINRHRIISCPGKSTCTHGIVDTQRCRMKIAEVLSGSDSGGKTIGISGCPNNCAGSAVCDIGLVGCIKTTENTRQEAFRVYTGGGNGKTEKLGALVETVWAEDVSSVVKKLTAGTKAHPAIS